MKTKNLYCYFLIFFFSGLTFTSFSQTKTLKAEIDEAVLQHIIEANKKFTKEGKVADYIPELGKADPNDIAVAVVDKNGKVFKAGDSMKKFTVQSISKLIGLMLAVEDRGEEEVFKQVGYFGTNQAFNHYANLETEGKPLNPMMNAGAILTTSMIKGEGEEAYQRILERIKYITNNEDIEINEAVYHSEKSTGDRNRGIFYILKNNGLIEAEEGNEDALNNYFKQCSIELNVVDLAKIGYFFANQGVRFDGDETYKNAELSALIQSQMLIAGMYDFSGEYARKIGLPSKSGVGGGITVSVPGKMGIGVYSPGLDKHGNSVAGFQMIKDLEKLMNLSLFK